MEKSIDIGKLKKGKSVKELLEFSIININKPSGPTSFDVVEYIARKLGLKKASHFGTLDPKVTGVLPVALSRACRLSQYFMRKDKTYVGVARLHEDVSDEKLEDAIKKYVGKIIQLPPVKSRVKRQERPREVYNFNVLEKDGKDILFETKVEAGTYIRKLIHDIGLEIGGAHMLELRRTEAGLFEEKESVSLYDFEKAVDEYKKGNGKKLREMLIPAEIISSILKVVHVNENALRKLYTGSPLFREMLEDEKEIKKIKKDESFSIFYKDKFIETAKLVEKGEILAKSEFVFNKAKD